MIFSRLLALVAALGAARGSPLAQGLAVGLVGRDCVVLAADTTLRRGATVLGRVTDRITTLAPGVLLATVGDPADARRVSLLKEPIRLPHHARNVPAPVLDGPTMPARFNVIGILCFGCI